jgi:hypothetical protein
MSLHCIRAGSALGKRVFGPKRWTFGVVFGFLLRVLGGFRVRSGEGGDGGEVGHGEWVSEGVGK